MFKNKKRNRRIESDHVLDVKLRSSQAKAFRFRVISTVAIIAFTLVFGIFVIWRGGEWMLNKFIYENEAFSVQQVEIYTDGGVSPEQIRTWAGVQPGNNLLSLDLNKVKRDLELVPVVSAAAVERVLPHTLRIKISERDPTAVITSGEGAPVYYVDEEGYVVGSREAQLHFSKEGVANLHFPVLSGVPYSQVKPGKKIETPQVHAALELISAFDRSAMGRIVDLVRINVDRDDALKTITSQGSEITFGTARFETQLNRWNIASEHFAMQGRAINTMDLSVSNNVPVTFSEATASTLRPKPAKTIKTKRRHV
jgi:cell division septal protein FtsQ